MALIELDAFALMALQRTSAPLSPSGLLLNLYDKYLHEGAHLNLELAVAFLYCGGVYTS